MKNYFKRAKLLNPIVVILYAVACYYLAHLARYGGISRRVPVIIFLFIILGSWFIYGNYKMRKQKDAQEVPTPRNSFTRVSRWWSYIAPLLIGAITLFTGYHIYQSAVPYNGKLSWYIQAWRSERDVVFEHNNIYEDGLTGLLTDVNQEVDLPIELYIAEEVSLTFDSVGEITDFYGFLYGEDEEGETQTFLISYDKSESENLDIHLDNYLDATYEEEKRLQPLIDGLAYAPVYELLGDQSDNNFHLYYDGFETRPDNFELTIYYDENGQVEDVGARRDVHVGYSFAIHFDTLGDTHPLYFIAYDPATLQKYDEQRALEEAQAADPYYFSPEEIADEYFLNEEIGYQLVMLDAMLGSRFYGLRQSVDGGETWEMLNPDPFLGSTGAAEGMTFIDENLGFAVLSHNGGANAQLFKTADGGQTFERVQISSVTVEQNGYEFEPFDFPALPYEENGQIVLYVNQGIDGDYMNNARARYVSDDNGSTFEFVEME